MRNLGRCMQSIVPLCMGVCCLFHPSWLSADDHPEYTLEEITDRLTEWQNKIVSVHVQAKQTWDPQSKLAHDSNVAGVERISYLDWLWTDADALRRASWTTFDGTVKMRSLYVMGTRHDWTALYHYGVSDETKPSHVTIGVPSAPGSKSDGTFIAQLAGLWRPTPPHWLAERLVESPPKHLEHVTLDGRPAVYLELDDSPAGRITEQLWLDPEHGFLPCRVAVEGSSEWTTTEFSEPEPGFFFPRRGREVQRITSNEVLQEGAWEITDIALNQPVPKDLWKPPIANGTEVTDMANKKRYVHGGDRYRPKPTENSAATAENPEGTPVRATSSNGGAFWWSTTFLGLAVLFLVVISYVRQSGR